MKDRGINKKREAGALIVTAQIARQILVIRGQKVILDADLAALYGVQTRRLNEQVRRNAERFPEDFVFQTSPAEFASLKSQFATSSWGGTRKLPLAFTEHGAIMAAMVLNSPRATEVPVYVVLIQPPMRTRVRGSWICSRLSRTGTKGVRSIRAVLRATSTKTASGKTARFC